MTGRRFLRTAAGIPVVQITQHLSCHFPEHYDLSLRKTTSEHAVGFLQAGAYLCGQFESALCGDQTFQSGIIGHTFPQDDAVFFQKLENSCRSRTTQAERAFDITLKDRAFLAVGQDVINHPALDAGNAQILEMSIKPGLHLVRQQVDPGTAVFFPPFGRKNLIYLLGCERYNIAVWGSVSRGKRKVYQPDL